jgi:Flp pilus assembly protein TadD
LLRAGSFEDAATELETIVRLAPDDASALHDLGGACLQLRRFDCAITAFTTLHARHPDDPEVSRWLAAARAGKTP